MDPRLANFLRRIFWLLNKFFMVPVFRLGLGALFGSPYGGYVMVIKNRGRLSGKIRYTPVNYAIADGCVYCVAGFDKIAHWYRNIQEEPAVELILPGRSLAAVAERVEDQAAHTGIMRQIMKNSGFAVFLFGGFNPFSASDERIRTLTADYILLRLRPAGLGNGPADQGGWLWMLPPLATLLALWLLLR